MKQKLIAVLLIVMVIVVGGVFWLSRSQEVMTVTQDTIRTELSSALGTVVTMGEVEIASYNTIVIHDITIYDKKTEPLLISENITVTYSPLHLLVGQAVVEAISDVAIDKPALFLSQAGNGRWNIQDLFNQNNESVSSFASKVRLLDGSVRLSAYGVVWTLEHVDGSLDFKHKPTMDLKLQAVHKGAAVKAEGRVNSQGRSTITVTADELLVADYRTLLTEQPLELVGGSVKNLEVVIDQNQGNTTWAGEVNLTGVDVDIDGMPVRHIQGNMTFTNKKIYVFAAAQLSDQPIDVRGSVRTDTSQQILDLTVSSKAFDPTVMLKNSAVHGKIAFKANISGIVSDPIIHGDVSLPTGNIAGYDISSAQANVLYMNKKLTIHHASAALLGGHAAVTGVIEPEASSYQLHVKAEDIDMNHIAHLIPGSSGRGNADVEIRGAGSYKDADVQGTLAIRQGGAAGVAFDSLSAGFYRRNGITVIDYANVGIAQGMVTAKGIIDQQTLNLTVYGQNINLQQLDAQVRGTGDFNGHITGTLSVPECAGNFTVVNGQALYQPFTQAQGNFLINRQQLVLKDVELINGVTRHSVQGTLSLDGQQDMNITVRTRQARAENLIRLLAPGERLTGNVDNDMTLTGPLNKFNVEGQVLLTDGSFRGQLIAKVHGFYKREQGVVTISQLSIDSLNTQIKLSGSISPDNELNVDITAHDIDMERLNLKLPYAAAGRAQFAGKLGGTLSAPVFSGQLSSDKLSFNHQDLTGIMGQVILRNNEIEIPSINFMQGTGKFSFAGGFGIENREIYGSLDVENAQLQPILLVLDIQGKDIHGTINGHARLDGTLDNPTIGLTGTLKQGRVKQYPIESINIDAAFKNNVLTINELSATQGAGLLVAQGTADLNGALNLEVGGRDIDAGFVGSLLNTTVEPKGKMGFTAQFSGLSNNPHIALSLEVLNGGVGSATFDSLYGLMVVENKTIHVNQVLLKKGPYRASAYGIVPVAAINPVSRKQASSADQMDLKVRLDEANLSILPFLTKEVTWAEGQTQGAITVTGTLLQPNMAGSITVNDGVVKLAELRKPIQKVAVNISFQGNTIHINKFDGQLGKGQYSLTGTAKLNGLVLSDYELSLLLKKPELESKYFTGPVDGQLDFRNVGGKPTLSGKLLFEDDIINIPTIPNLKPSELDIGLDVEMTVGKKVRFYNPYLYDMIARGHLKFAGSTFAPDFSGKIAAVQGTVNYLNTQFKVSEASVEFKKFTDYDPMISVNAQTRLQQIVVNLAVNGPLSGMKVTLSSEPSMRQQEILSLLTLRSRYLDKQSSANSGGIGRDELVSVLGAGLQMQFFSDVEGNLRRALGLDEFRIVQDTTSTIIKKSYSDREESTTVSQEVYNIEISKYLTDKVMLSYIMGVDHKKSDLSLRYTLSKHTSLTTSIDEKNRTWVGFETRYRF